uniref:Fibronectin type-III domain-containing protein n=1 Tax=Ciona savignyi TaxID=51511 RepID=H2YQ44_CIOSA
GLIFNMHRCLQDAIETVDNARQHKCELEGRQKQLQYAIAQVKNTANLSRKEIQIFFNNMQETFTREIDLRKNELVNEVNITETEALGPLDECHTFMEEGINEAAAVVSVGENVLHCESESLTKGFEFENFIKMAESLSLDSVPEIPLITEVPSISFTFNEEFVSDISKSLKNCGEVSHYSPVQIVDLKPIPGGIVISWSENIEPDISSSMYSNQFKDSKIFKDCYVGPDLCYTLRFLQPNTIYTFRVCRCQYFRNSDTTKRWSPWSVFQEQMTTMVGFQWAPSSDSISYFLSDNQRAAIKKSNHVKILYTVESKHTIGYPVSFKFELEGKSLNKSDCLAICFKKDPDATCLHTKSGTFCVMADGHVWMNGSKSGTRFTQFSRGKSVTFEVSYVSHKNQSNSDKSNSLRVSIIVGQHSAVFNWNPGKSMMQLNVNDLAFAMLFISPGWKVSIF